MLSKPKFNQTKRKLNFFKKFYDKWIFWKMDGRELNNKAGLMIKEKSL
jgi:hypothetical protein